VKIITVFTESIEYQFSSLAPTS